jgi:hypothetical protein
MASEQIFLSIGEQLARIVRPLEASLASEVDFALLLRDFGWEVDPTGFDITAVRGAVNVAGDFAAAARLFGEVAAEEFPSLGKYTELVEVLRRILDAVRGLSNHPPPSGIPSEAWGTVTAELLGALLAGYLETTHPAILAALLLGGIVTEEEIAPGGVSGRVAYMRRRIAWGRLGTLLTDPGALARDLYDWADPNAVFRFDLLLPRLARALQLLGLPAQDAAPSATLLDQYYDPSNSFRLQVRQLALTLMQGQDETGNALDTAIFVLPIPETGDRSGQPRGIALGPSISVTAAPPASLFWPFSLDLAGSGGHASYNGARLDLLPSGIGIHLASPGATDLDVSARLGREEQSPIVFGSVFSHRLELYGVGLGILIRGSIGDPEVALQLDVPQARLVIDVSDMQGVLGSIFGDTLGPIEFGIALVWSSKTGLAFSGRGALRVAIPLTIRLGPVQLNTLTLGLEVQPGGATEVIAAITGNVSIGPLAVTVERIGLRLRMLPVTAEQPVGTFGDLDLQFGFRPPDGLGIAISAGAIAGGGFLAREDGPPERFSGALAIRLTSFAVVAFGIFERTPSGRIAFVMVLGIRFFPGFQLGFGFALTGVGGLIGINRRADTDALRERLVSGAAGNVLFAEDPISNAPTLLGDLGALFPAADGIYVLGPTLQIGWLTFARFDLGIVIELPGPSRILLLGVARFLIGGENGLPALLQIRLDILGSIDFVKKLVAFDAALINSQLLGIFRLTGNAAFRLSSGERPYVMLTIGGFHPAFNPEPVVLPPISRIALTYDLSAGVRIRLRFEGYLALTSNTFQLGAALQAGIEAGPLNAVGFLSFDALIQLKPFYFTFDFRAGFRIRWKSLTLAGVQLSGTVSGPGPIVISASFSFEILFFEISWSDTFRLGDEGGDQVRPVASLTQALAPELGIPGNLEAIHSVDREVAMAPRSNAPRALVAPQGQLIWRQKRAPLNVMVERLEGAPLARHQAVIIESAQASGATQDWFSPGTYVNLSESEAINRSAFDRLDAGVQLGFGFQKSVPVLHPVEIVTFRLPEPAAQPPLDLLFFPAILLDAITGRRAPGRVFAAAPLIGVRDEGWTVRGSDGSVIADGVRQTDAHQRARAVSAIALPALDASDSIDLGGI